MPWICWIRVSVVFKSSLVDPEVPSALERAWGVRWPFLLSQSWMNLWTYRHKATDGIQHRTPAAHDHRCLDTNAGRQGQRSCGKNGAEREMGPVPPPPAVVLCPSWGNHHPHQLTGGLD